MGFFGTRPSTLTDRRPITASLGLASTSTKNDWPLSKPRKDGIRVLGRLDGRRRDVLAAGAVGLELHAHARDPHLGQAIGLQAGRVAARGQHAPHGVDAAEPGADGVEVGALGVGIEPEGVPQHVVGRARVDLVEPAGVGEALGGDAPPLLVHVVVALAVVVGIGRVGPGGVGVVDVQALLLLVLPPAVAPLEDQAADGVADPALARGLLVDLPPLAQQVVGLARLVLLHGDGVEGVGPELGEHGGHAQLLGPRPRSSPAR